MTEREKLRVQLLYWPGAYRLKRLFGYENVDAAVDAILRGDAPWFDISSCKFVGT